METYKIYSISSDEQKKQLDFDTLETNKKEAEKALSSYMKGFKKNKSFKCAKIKDDIWIAEYIKSKEAIIIYLSKK